MASRPTKPGRAAESGIYARHARQSDGVKGPQFASACAFSTPRFWDMYLPQHAAGAINADAKEWIAAFISNPSRANWEKRLAVLGIDRTAPVVVYDEGSNKDAASVRAILRYWGFTDVRLLNGGWHAWLSAGGPHDPKAPYQFRKRSNLNL